MTTNFLAFPILFWSIAACRDVHAGPPPPPPAAAAEPADPPSRVARLSYLQGPVSFKAAGDDEWVAAALNRPLTTGDSLWTDRDARAELTLGSAALWLDANTSMSFLNLDDRLVQVKLSQGALRIHVRVIEGDDSLEIDTPSAAIDLLRSGDYRIEANPDTDGTRIIVRGAGLADVAGGAQPLVVRANQEAILTGRNTVADVRAAPPLDGFDQFCDRREARAGRTEAEKYVSRDVIGWEDLDGHGAWEMDAGYGPIWYPRVIAPGWAPYRYGHWVWIHPWGWTWIDDTPWGFAPFHYGRWVFLRTRWGWVPGPRRTRVVFAPALVVFVGGGGGLRYHVRVGVDIGIGWFPLGPHEVYIPPYRASRTYITNVNITHTVIRDPASIHRVDVTRQPYMNRSVAGAITAVREDAFTGGRRISRVAAPLSERDAAQVQVRGTMPPVGPTRESVTGRVGEEGRSAARPPESARRREVVVRRTPAPAAPSVEQSRGEWQRDPGRPPDATATERIRRQEPQPRAQPEYRQLPEQERRRSTQTTGPRQTQPRAQPQPQPRVERPAASERRGTTETTGPRQTQPQAAPQTPPRVERPTASERRAADRTGREAEQRRRTIEQEHQRQDGPQQQQQQQQRSEPQSQQGRGAAPGSGRRR